MVKKVIRVRSFIFVLITALLLVVEASGAAGPVLLFEDDFSTDQGWTDESGGFIYRDAGNEWLVWHVRRDTRRRYYIPLDAAANEIQVSFRFNVTSGGGNSDVWLGLVEDLDGPDWVFDISGVVIQVGRDGVNGPRVRVLAQYADGFQDNFPIPAAPSYGSFNVWRRATFSLKDGDWTTVVYTDEGVELGRQSGTLSGTHEAYPYLMVFRDDTGGFEYQNGLFDDLEVWGFRLTQEVQIDIKPEGTPNSINPASKGSIPVAILTTADFDATTVDPLSVEFGPEGAAERHGKGHLEDVDGDGDLDLLLHFKTQQTGIQCGDTSATLTGTTFEGQPIEGSDAVNPVGCK